MQIERSRLYRPTRRRQNSNLTSRSGSPLHLINFVLAKKTLHRGLLTASSKNMKAYLLTPEMRAELGMNLKRVEGAH